MSADEFDIIAKYFAPLATLPGARGLIDDAAVLETRGRLVVTTDTIVEGVHFLAADPLDTVAKKALRVNLSDLAAKGAKPIAVVINLVWPMTRAAEEIEIFARGLAEDLALYDVALLGGDTTSTPNGLVVSITAFGEPLGERTPSRSDAKIGEDVWVTGYIGEAYLGLLILTGQPDILGPAPEGSSRDYSALQAKAWYRSPKPPVKFAPAIAEFASASMDISDGLIGDARKMAAASNVAIRIEAPTIPLLGGEVFVESHGTEGLVQLVTGGDDYQALFTAPPERRDEIAEAGTRFLTNLTRIGSVIAGQGVEFIDANGAAIPLPAAGYSHKLGR